MVERRPSRRSRSSNDDIKYIATPRTMHDPVVDIPPESQVTVRVTDGSVWTGTLYDTGYNILPNWIMYARFDQTVISVRMPDGRVMVGGLGVKDKPTRRCAIAPTSVTVNMLDGNCKNALLEFFDRGKDSKLLEIKNTETRTFVGMEDGLVYTGYFR